MLLPRELLLSYSGLTAVVGVCLKRWLLVDMQASASGGGDAAAHP